jgi:hypothetical protein
MSPEQRILAGLVQRGIPLHIAQGMVANMIAESRLDPGINEIAPLVPGSRGGFGLNQWTGPRRRALEAEAQRLGVPVDDLDFQLDFTLNELRGPESRAWGALSAAPDAETAARLYSEKFLRPGIPHMENRLSHARRLAGAPFEMGEDVPAPEQEAPNRLSRFMAPPQISSQDPQAFMRQPNRLAPVPYQAQPYLTRRLG